MRLWRKLQRLKNTQLDLNLAPSSNKNFIVLSTSQNFFELFDLSVTFEVDSAALTTRYRELQNQTHPDRFSGGTEQEKMLAVQSNSFLNEAYATLSSPLKRAGYLLQLQNIDTEIVDQSDMDMSVLMEQMQLREKLAELPSDESALSELESMKCETKLKLQQKQEKFALEYDGDEIGNAKRIFHEMQFLQKLLTEIEQGEEQRLGY